MGLLSPFVVVGHDSLHVRERLGELGEAKPMSGNVLVMVLVVVVVVVVVVEARTPHPRLAGWVSGWLGSGWRWRCLPRRGFTC